MSASDVVKAAARVIVPADHLPEWMGGPIDGFSATSGLPSDQIRLLICLLSALPLGWLHRLTPTATLRHVFSIVVGSFFCWFVVGNSAYCVPFSALIVYFLVQIVPRETAPVLVFIASVAWLSAWHLYRLYEDYMGWSLDATMILMIWTVKASTFAYNVADGKALNLGLKLSERDSTHTFRAERALTTLPSLLEYFSYVFFFGGVLVGPCFEAKEYFDFIDGKLLKKHNLASAPSTYLPALKCLLVGLGMYAGIFVASLYPILPFVTTSSFGNMAFGAKFLYFWIAITSSRFKYYFAWCLGEAGCVAAGFGLNGTNKDGSFLWDRVSNCNMQAVELAPHMTDVTSNWNMGVNNWLKNYVYFRVNKPKWLPMPAKSFTNLVTKATSAFWHGFYPSYYVFFFGAWLANEMDDAMRASFEGEVAPEVKKARAKSWYKGPRGAYEWLSFFMCTTTMNFWGTCFVLLRADYAWMFAKNMYFIGIVLPVVMTALCRTVFRRKRAAKEGLQVRTGGASVRGSEPAGSPDAKTVSAAIISSVSPTVPPPKHDDVMAVPHPVRQAVEVVEATDDSPASGVKNRPRRSRSNKAE